MAEGITERDHRAYKITSMANQDLAALVERIDTVLTEVLMSQSSPLENMREADRLRLDDHIKFLKDYKAWMVAQPEVDSPQTHPEKVPIEYLSNREKLMDSDTGEEHVIIQNPENKAVRDLARLLRTLLGEMSLSASRRMPNGMSAPDAKRFDTHIAKIEAFLSAYVDTNQPLDTPETNPSSPMSGHGFT